MRNIVTTNTAPVVPVVKISRQVRRQRERLAAKPVKQRPDAAKRSDAAPAWMLNPRRLRNLPHVGKKQIARGLRLIALGRAYG